MRRYKLFFSHEAVATLAAIPTRRRLTLFNLMDAIALFPHDGNELQGERRKQPALRATVRRMANRLVGGCAGR